MTRPIPDAGEAMPTYSLATSILRYKAEWSTFLASTLEAGERGESDNLPRTYQPAERVIASWNRPAENPQEAFQALKMALEDYEAGETPRIPAMIKAAMGFLQASAANIQPPKLRTAEFSTKDLCRIYRILDTIEETTNMADQYVRYIDKEHTPVASYLTDLQEYLASERVDIVDALRARPHTNDGDGRSRIATIVQYEAWCEEFQTVTLKQLAASSLTAEAF
ncbi:hypothetical protein [Rhizobium sp. YTU87027]|uniref:hypothetical protein n=1 Tax=Rhizobium sp. YTU87027 TaxID=3417741 RepID=UPI003D6889E4